MANYAQNALWWALNDPDVRALATILTAPPLWHSGCELPVRELLGAQGFRFLLSLDAAPTDLHQYLEKYRPFAHRLGFYAERLLAFWLEYAPHCRLLAQNLPVVRNGQTLGALDYVAQINEKIYHIELTCKYYFSGSHELADFVGLNRKDTFLNKYAKLNSQLALSASVDGKKVLYDLLGGTESVQAASIVRGMGFCNESMFWQQQPLNPYAWTGSVIHDVQALMQYSNDQTAFHMMHPMQLLAPACVHENECHDLVEIAQHSSAYIAVLARREDGLWHEQFRVAKIIDDVHEAA